MVEKINIGDEDRHRGMFEKYSQADAADDRESLVICFANRASPALTYSVPLLWLVYGHFMFSCLF